MRRSDPSDPAKRELEDALQELRQAGEHYRRRQEASRRSLWGNLVHGARMFGRFLGWSGS
jgi:hypothetical protein